MGPMSAFTSVSRAMMSRWLPSSRGSTVGHVFYEEFKIFWVGLKVLGMFPYHVTKRGDVVFKRLSKEMVYSVAVHFALSIPVWIVLHSQYRQLLLLRSFDHVIFSITMAMLMAPHTSVPWSHWVQCETFGAVFRAWRDFQVAFRQLTGCSLQFHPRWRLLVILPCVISYSPVFFAIHLSILTTEKERFCLETLCYFYVATFFFIHNVIFFGQCFVIVHVARNLKFLLKKAILEEDLEGISKCTLLWFNVSGLSRLIGVLFFRMHASFLLMIFALSTMASYTLLAGVAQGQYSTSFLKVVLCFDLNQVWIYLFCESGERVSYEVGFGFMAEAAELRLRSRNLAVREKVLELMDTIHRFPPTVSLNGFTDINRKLFVTILSTMTTYLIVVWQFSRVPPCEAPLSAVGNSTNVHI